MFTGRKTREEAPPVQLQPKAESLPREPGGTSSLQEASSLQQLTPVETPWENVTLNRCLFVAISILVLTSGFQRLNETIRGHRAVEDEEAVGLMARRPGSLRHRGQTLEPETSLWDVMLWWLPDFDDEDDDEDEDDEDEDDGGLQGRKIKQRRETGPSSGLRNKPLPDKKLMKRRDGTLKERRAKKDKEEEEPEGEEEDGEEEEDKETIPRKSRKNKREKKSQKG